MGPLKSGVYNRGMRCGVLRADLVVVSKQKREMVLLRGESVLRTYRIALGREPKIIADSTRDPSMVLAAIQKQKTVSYDPGQ